MSNMTKRESYNKLIELLGGDKVSIDHLYDYFSSNELQGFLEHLEDEFAM